MYMQIHPPVRHRRSNGERLAIAAWAFVGGPFGAALIVAAVVLGSDTHSTALGWSFALVTLGGLGWLANRCGGAHLGALVAGIFATYGLAIAWFVYWLSNTEWSF